MENSTQKEANLPTFNCNKLVPFRPILTPYNDAARQCLGVLFNQMDGLPAIEHPPPKPGKTELKTLGKPYSNGLIAVNMPNAAWQKQLLRMLH